MTKQTFADHVEAALDELQAEVFPDRTERESRYTGRVATRIEWHQVPTEAQQVDRMRRGMTDSRTATLSACDRVDYAKSEMPRRIKRSTPRNLCEACIKAGDLNEQQMLEAVEAVIANAHARSAV